MGSVTNSIILTGFVNERQLILGDFDLSSDAKDLLNLRFGNLHPLLVLKLSIALFASFVYKNHYNSSQE